LNANRLTAYDRRRQALGWGNGATVRWGVAPDSPNARLSYHTLLNKLCAKVIITFSRALGTLAGDQLSRFNRFDCWRQQLGPSIIIAQRWFPERLPAGVARTRLAYSINWVSRRSGTENTVKPIPASHNAQIVNLRLDFD